MAILASYSQDGVPEVVTHVDGHALPKQPLDFVIAIVSCEREDILNGLLHGIRHSFLLVWRLVRIEVLRWRVLVWLRVRVRMRRRLVPLWRWLLRLLKALWRWRGGRRVVGLLGGWSSQTFV